MKTYLISLTLICISYFVHAQQASPTGSSDHKLYVGFGLTSVSYHIYYDEQKTVGSLTTGYFVPFAIYTGYRLNHRSSVQLGVAYGGSKDSGSWQYTDASGVSAKYNEDSKTHVVALPITGKFIFFNVEKRFSIYGAATIMPAWGVTNYNISEQRNGVEPDSELEEKYDGMNLFATAGVGVNFKLSHRFTGYAEVIPFKYNVTGHNSYHHDWEQYSSLPRKLFKSLGLGINYKL